MDEHTQKLQELLQKDTLTAGEVLDGVVACFFSTNRAFVQRRLGSATPENVNQALESLIRRIFTEYHINTTKPSLSVLQKARLVVDEQSGFEAEPDLLNAHKAAIDQLFAKAQSGERE